MSENIVEQVRGIEAEAERIVAEATGKAQELEGSVDAETAELRRRREHDLQRQVEKIEQELRGKTHKAHEELEHKALAATVRLENIDQQAKQRAVESVLKRLREG